MSERNPSYWPTTWAKAKALAKATGERFMAAATESRERDAREAGCSECHDMTIAYMRGFEKGKGDLAGANKAWQQEANAREDWRRAAEAHRRLTECAAGEGPCLDCDADGYFLEKFWREQGVTWPTEGTVIRHA